MMMSYLYIALTIAFTVYGQLILKWRLIQMNLILPEGLIAKIKMLTSLLFDPFILSGFVSAFFASLAWMAAMTKFELSTAYPFMALNFVIVFALAIPLFNEVLSWQKVLGTVLIILGTVIIAKV